ncbi:hypothetical protein [Pseudomonas sp. EL_65y_Pfl2_R96]|uniref:hypothetical protein n=1 Tax=Pseudomonas sp. EL_65y_Pfl2_R96 TaxID=3088699 RepID=UPI0030DAD354
MGVEQVAGRAAAEQWAGVDGQTGADQERWIFGMIAESLNNCQVPTLWERACSRRGNISDINVI